MVEGLGLERKIEDVRLQEIHVGQPGFLRASPGFGERLGGDVHRREAGTRASLGERHRLGTHAAPGLQHGGAGWVGGVGVQQVDQGSGLIVQPLLLSRLIAVHVDFAHGATSARR